ncbi:MAG: LacI family transcriptional regulator, partial [Pseudonocardiales bacterium]|nr:LacI family transcriptional regulator [Pseudonocardiales bacterium]
LQCPRDYSITGFNDLSFMSKLTPALTTVRVPLAEMGAHAARTLLGWIGSDGNPTSLRVLLPVELIIRGTTSPH